MKHGKSLSRIAELGEKPTRRKQPSECLQLLSQMNSASHSNDSDQGFTAQLPPTFSLHCLERPDPAAVRKLPSAAVVHRKGPVPGADSWVPSLLLVQHTRGGPAEPGSSPGLRGGMLPRETRFDQHFSYPAKLWHSGGRAYCQLT